MVGLREQYYPNQCDSVENSHAMNRPFFFEPTTTAMTRNEDSGKAAVADAGSKFIAKRIRKTAVRTTTDPQKPLCNPRRKQ